MGWSRFAPIYLTLKIANELDSALNSLEGLRLQNLRPENYDRSAAAIAFARWRSLVTSRLGFHRRDYRLAVLQHRGVFCRDPIYPTDETRFAIQLRILCDGRRERP